MGKRRLLSPADVQRVQEMYAMVNDKGRRVHTILDIAEVLDVSQSTVWHAVNRKGTYRNDAEAKSNEEIRAAAEEISKHSLATLAKEKGIVRYECKSCQGVIYQKEGIAPEGGFLCASCRDAGLKREAEARHT